MSEAETEKYTPELFEDYEIGEYRKRFPLQTSNLTDEEIFNIAMNTIDDMEDEKWIALFEQATLQKLNSAA